MSESENKGKQLKGKVQIDKKEGTKRKIVNFLFSDKLDSMGNYLLYSILKPGLNTLVYNLCVGGLNMMFGRDGGGQQAAPFNPMGYQNTARRDTVAYNLMSNPGYGQPQFQSYSAAQDIRSISFDLKDDAWTVIERLGAVIQRYGKASVADFYRCCDMTPPADNWTLGASGWYAIGNAQPILGTNGRWYVDLPPVQGLR